MKEFLKMCAICYGVISAIIAYCFSLAILDGWPTIIITFVTLGILIIKDYRVNLSL
jgi:CHASE2 domain-containing sensor protein